MKISVFIICLSFVACSGKQENTVKPLEKKVDSVQNSNAESTDQKGTDERSNWQKPAFIISSLGDLKDKTLADIGSGALGYFVFKILGQTEIEKIIAVDIDKEAVRMLNLLKNALNEKKASRLDVRLADINDPKLKYEEVDIILIVNTIAYLPNTQSYLEELKPKLKPGGKIVIVDFKTKRIPDYVDAPPYEERLLLHIIEEKLYKAGYKNIYTDDTSLEYQYYISAEI